MFIFDIDQARDDKFIINTLRIRTFYKVLTGIECLAFLYTRAS